MSKPWKFTPLGDYLRCPHCKHTEEIVHKDLIPKKCPKCGIELSVPYILSLKEDNNRIITN